MAQTAKLSDATLKRIRDYVVAEPSYTCAFAAWELGMSTSAVHIGNKEMLRLGIVKEIEPRSGPYGAVYAYDPPKATAALSNGARNVSRLFPELDASHHERNLVGTEAPPRGSEVAHTGKAVGPSGSPRRDRKRQQQGFRVKRARQGT